MKGTYDPNYAYYRRVNAADPNWEPSLRTLYTARSNGEIPVLLSGIQPPVEKTAPASRRTCSRPTRSSCSNGSHDRTHVQTPPRGIFDR